MRIVQIPVNILNGVNFLWKRLPDRLQKLCRRNVVYRVVLRQYFERNVNFVKAKISIDDFSITVPVPEKEHPWWSGYEDYNCHEPLATRTYIQEICSGDVVWDMGSMFGYETAIAIDQTGNPELVHVFEVMSSSGVLLNYVSARYYDGRLNVVNKAVDEQSSVNSIAGDDYAAKHGCPDFIKIDIDGYETKAIRGMKNLIVESQPIILLEIHPANIRRQTGDTDRYLVEFLTKIYDDITVCWEFRELNAEWDEFDETDWERQHNYRHNYQMLFR